MLVEASCKAVRKDLVLKEDYTQLSERAGEETSDSSSSTQTNKKKKSSVKKA
jgi:hypothetical protein